MTALERLVDHFRKSRAQMLSDITLFESGTVRLGETRPEGHFDITEQWIAELRRRIAELDDIIAKHERGETP